jgi:hypothetical protein
MPITTECEVSFGIEDGVQARLRNLKREFGKRIAPKYVKSVRSSVIDLDYYHSGGQVQLSRRILRLFRGPT